MLIVLTVCGRQNAPVVWLNSLNPTTFSFGVFAQPFGGAHWTMPNFSV